MLYDHLKERLFFTGVKTPSGRHVRYHPTCFFTIEGRQQKKGFKIVDKRYVRAGHFDEALKSSDSHAKEILIIAKK